MLDRAAAIATIISRGGIAFRLSNMLKPNTVHPASSPKKSGNSWLRSC